MEWSVAQLTLDTSNNNIKVPYIPLLLIKTVICVHPSFFQKLVSKELILSKVYFFGKVTWKRITLHESLGRL